MIPYEKRTALGFTYITLAFLLIVTYSIYKDRKYNHPSCCGSRICEEQKHHE